LTDVWASARFTPAGIRGTSPELTVSVATSIKIPGIILFVFVTIIEYIDEDLIFLLLASWFIR
jgi:hypothetical protein